MGLVDYSDSEDSDADVAPAPKAAPSKPSFPKVVHRGEAKKIRVDLPAPGPDSAPQDEEQHRPAKRARTGGAFSGFNSLLPAPKGRGQSGPKPGVSLKTSSEAAFQRAPIRAGGTGGEAGAGGGTGWGGEKEAEPKIVGKATKFKPLSVANSKKKPVKKATAVADAATKSGFGVSPPEKRAVTERESIEASLPAGPSAPKAKRSLFSVHTEDALAPEPDHDEQYESITATDPSNTSHSHLPTEQPPPKPDPNSLQTIASDLNLTPAQRRQLFGRNAGGADINIARFNMDSEYAANEQARQAGEVVEHRAVKAIAPGKHSLQQLVNNAKTQQGAMEDKWAEGRRERGEAGGKYGWGK